MDIMNIKESLLKVSFEKLQQLIELMEGSILMGLIKIEGDTVFVFRELWDNWDEEGKNGFKNNVLAYYKVKYASFNGLNIYIKCIETGEELGIILIDVKVILEKH